MLIVSQNGKTVINLNVVQSFGVSPKNEIDVFGIYSEAQDYMPYHIAAYESETKAKSVLVQMWSDYANGKKVFIMP